mgnify:CR=1 FL=1
MCNLYAMTKGPAAIRAWFKADTGRLGNFEPLPAIFPDQMAPVIRLDDGAPVCEFLRWGFPPPPKGNRPVTNVRNTASSFWKPWLKQGRRCLVLASSFCEYEDTKPRKTPTWFALGEGRPLFAFAGIWRPWTGQRTAKEDEAEHQLFSFLTCEANAEVAPIHPKAMPVILRDAEEADLWLNGPSEAALSLQRPLPDGSLAIVARGKRSDAALETGA